MSASDVTWEDPPETNFSSYEWFYELLRQNPGEWAVYPGSQPAAWGYCRRNSEFEQRSRTTDGETKTWMRRKPT